MLAVLKISASCVCPLSSKKYLICNKALMHIELRYNRWKAMIAFNKVNF